MFWLHKYSTFILLYICALTSFAKDTVIDISLSSYQVQEGEPVTLSIDLSGNLDRNIVLPEVSGLSISGSGESTSVSIINGSYSKKTTYSFTILVHK